MEKSVVATYHNSCRSFPHEIETDSWIGITSFIILLRISSFDIIFGSYLRPNIKIYFIHLKFVSVITI